MIKKYIGIVPFWPLGTPVGENYFLEPGRMGRKKGYQVEIWVVGEKRKESMAEGMLVRFFGSVGELERSLPKEAIIHCQTMYRQILLLLARLWLKKERRKKVIWTPHLAFGKRGPVGLPVSFWRVFRFIFGSLGRIMAITEYEEKCLKSCGYQNVIYLPLVIDGKRFQSEVDQDLIRLGKSLRVIFVGGDREVKGLAGVLRAVKIMEKLRFKVELVVMGKMETSLTLAGVKFLGEVDPESKLFEESWEKADIYINNSRCEGCPLAVGEAIVAGLGLCLPALPTLKSLFRENANYHELGNEAQLVRSILFWAYNPELLRKTTRNNKGMMKDFSRVRFEAKFGEILDGLCLLE